MKTLLTLGAVLALAGATGPANAAKPPAKGGTLTVALAPALVSYGSITNVSGAISTKAPGVALILEAQPHPFTGKWFTAGTTTTAADGSYTFATKPLIATHYRVTTKDKPAITSAEVGVKVRWKVGLGVGDLTPRKGQSVRFSGSIKPGYAGGAVLIQRRSSLGWKTFKQLPLTTSAIGSTYSVRVKIRKNGSYRSVVMGNGAYEDGISRVRRLIVH
jgi:hypothetical protein